MKRDNIVFDSENRLEFIRNFSQRKTVDKAALEKRQQEKKRQERRAARAEARREIGVRYREALCYRKAATACTSGEGVPSTQRSAVRCVNQEPRDTVDAVPCHDDGDCCTERASPSQDVTHVVTMNSDFYGTAGQVRITTQSFDTALNISEIDAIDDTAYELPLSSHSSVQRPAKQRGKRSSLQAKTPTKENYRRNRVISRRTKRK